MPLRQWIEVQALLQMKLKIVQRGGDNKWRHPRLQQAVVHYARTLRIPHPKHLDITLKLSNAASLCETTTRGKCRAEAECIDGKPIKFTITLQRDMPWTWTLTTLAHEMLHVEQQAKGRLRYKWGVVGWLWSWDGSPWVSKDTIAYENRPWEIDARNREDALCQPFFKIEECSGNYYYPKGS